MYCYYYYYYYHHHYYYYYCYYDSSIQLFVSVISSTIATDSCQDEYQAWLVEEERRRQMQDICRCPRKALGNETWLARKSHLNIFQWMFQ